MKRVLLGVLLFAIFVSSGCNSHYKIRILILSGSNNHDWSTTTPFLKNMYSETELFSVEITEKPDTLKSIDLEKYDVIVSNWNSWPENDIRWDETLENGILKFINEGGGFVFFHASTSVFYKWPEFREITTASWEEKTNHGKRDSVEVFIENQNHPVTNGLKDFKLLDELWIEARANKEFAILGSATDKKQKKEGNKYQSAIFVKEEGKGRIFHTILGHDVEAMKSDGFKKLMVRGSEWAATGKVTFE